MDMEKKVDPRYTAAAHERSRQERAGQTALDFGCECREEFRHYSDGDSIAVILCKKHVAGIQSTVIG